MFTFAELRDLERRLRNRKVLSVFVDTSAMDGICAITYRPDLLCCRVAARSEFRIALDADHSATLTGDDWPAPRRFLPPKAQVAHTRHGHKYTYGRLPAHRRFYFRNQSALTGHTASNLPEFVSEVARVPADVVRHHASHRDFSRWLGDLCRDPRLAAAVQDMRPSGAGGRAPKAWTPITARPHDEPGGVRTEGKHYERRASVTIGAVRARAGRCVVSSPTARDMGARQRSHAPRSSTSIAIPTSGYRMRALRQERQHSSSRTRARPTDRRESRA